MHQHSIMKNSRTTMLLDPPRKENHIGLPPATHTDGPFEYAHKPQRIISGKMERALELIVEVDRIKSVLSLSRSLREGFKTLQALAALKANVVGAQRISKKVKVDGRYYWDLYTPGWPGKVFKQYLKGEMNRITPLPGKSNRFTNVFIAITKKCPLQCEHCFEWDALNQKDTLTLEQLKQTVQRLYDAGTSQIQLTGGEPMLRAHDMVELISTSPKDIDFWVLTSGIKFTAENARRLKEAGLTGVVVSLDHFDPMAHNLFRGNTNSYSLALRAVKNAIEANLVTALSLCVTRDFMTPDNLMAYAALAKKMGVAFVQVLEPKAAGHYSGMDVLLHEEHIHILEEFYFKMNFDTVFADYPLIIYHGYYQRKIGCFGSGSRSVYIDTDGDVMPCPFCRRKVGHSLAPEMKTLVDQLSREGCSMFRQSPF